MEFLKQNQFDKKRLLHHDFLDTVEWYLSTPVVPLQLPSKQEPYSPPATEAVSTEWKDIYEDKPYIIAEERSLLAQEFSHNEAFRTKPQNQLATLLDLQAQIAYQSKLKENLDMFTDQLNNSIASARRKILQQEKLREALKEQYASAQRRAEKTNKDQLRKKALSLLGKQDLPPRNSRMSSNKSDKLSKNNLSNEKLILRKK